ncbi:MAG: type II secretion system protein [bacterium]|nr:type II secretion system protein [bacterium]
MVELVSCSAVIIVLASLTLPVANTMVKRQKELELRQALREIRVAIDRFQLDTTRYPGIKQNHINSTNEEAYPEDLAWLVEGIDIGDAAGTTLKYLRRLPLDPISGSDEWGTRSSRDGPDALFTDGINIFDVFSDSDKVGLNGVPYAKW